MDCHSSYGKTVQETGQSERKTKWEWSCCRVRASVQESQRQTRKRKETLIKEFTSLFENTEQAQEFVEEQFNRLSRNRWERYKRMIRRAYLQPWDYFVTFTFDSEKHTEESFRKQLMNCLYHLSNRKGWRYIGVWERGELGKRLHFHALMYIPQGAMVGELEEHNRACGI